MDSTLRSNISVGLPLDMVLYCAGHYNEMRASSMDLHDLRQHLAINYTGALNVLHAVLPAMTERGSGHVSSNVNARKPPKNIAIFAMSILPIESLRHDRIVER